MPSFRRFSKRAEANTSAFLFPLTSFGRHCPFLPNGFGGSRMQSGGWWRSVIAWAAERRNRQGARNWRVGWVPTRSTALNAARRTNWPGKKKNRKKEKRNAKQRAQTERHARFFGENTLFERSEERKIFLKNPQGLTLQGRGVKPSLLFLFGFGLFARQFSFNSSILTQLHTLRED